MNHWGPFEDWATATMNVTYTQANAAGGAVVCEITPNRGNEFIVIYGRALCSGTNGISVAVETATGGTTISQANLVASAASTNTTFGVGMVGTAVTVSGNAMGGVWPLIVSGTQALKISQTVAGAQSDTFQVLINIRCSGPSVPNVIHSNSTNPANVSVTAGAESFTVIG